MPVRERRRAATARMDGRRRAATLMLRAGVGLRESRIASRLTQAEAADLAGVSQPFWSPIERGQATTVSMETLASCAAAVGVQLAAFIEALPGASLPRDIEHLRRQELVIVMSRAGGWEGRPEVAIDPTAHRSRSIDVLLTREGGQETCVVEVVDLLADGGAALRGLADKVASIRQSGPAAGRVAGLLVLRATRRNRTTMTELVSLFATRFPGSSAAWLRALSSAESPMPLGDGVLWSSVAGDRLMAVGRASRL